MMTTVELPGDLLERSIALARRENTTHKALIEEGLRLARAAKACSSKSLGRMMARRAIMATPVPPRAWGGLDLKGTLPMTAMPEQTPQMPAGFGPIFRSSPVLDALGGFMSRGADESLEIGLLIGPNHLNARGYLHGGVISTLLDVGIGYMLVARSNGQRRVTARLTVDYRSSAQAGEWLQVFIDQITEDGRKTLATGRVMAGERCVAQAEALFIST